MDNQVASPASSQTADDMLSELSDVLPPILNTGGEQTEQEDEILHDTLNNFSSNLAKQFSITPGINIQEQRQQRAEANGLTFACIGRQPVDDIWQIYPGRKHKLEAYSLALDIAESVGLEGTVEHVVKNPVDYTYRMFPLETPPENEITKMCYDLLVMLQTDDEHRQPSSIALSPLLDSNAFDDVTLVKLFRLIRLVRYMRQGASYDTHSYNSRLRL